MNYLTDRQADALLEEARSASANTHSPYSGFPVGAAVLTADGSIFRGTNVENASYGLTICAERIAIGNAITNGSSKIAAIAVYAPVDSISPCGACRQFILEFGADIVVIFRHEQITIQKTIKELLPFEFSKTSLSQKLSRDVNNL
jgi:cytidine deaminase